MDYVIYVLKFADCDKVYVGVTENATMRFRDHLYHLKNGSHICRPLQALFDLKGEDSLSIHEIGRCEKTYRDFFERLYAAQFGPDRVLNQHVCRKAAVVQKRDRSSAVVCDTTGDRFDTIRDAAAWLCVTRWDDTEENRKRAYFGIWGALNGRLRSYKGLSWKTA